MKTGTKVLRFAGMPLVAMLLLFSCQKEATVNNADAIPSGQAKYSVYLADGPTDYQKVLIDIQRIDIKIDTCRRNGDDDHDRPGCDDEHDSMRASCDAWYTLNIHPGIYDLLTLRNGLDTLLASGFTLNGKLERIKVTLGSNNSVMADSVVHPLHLLSPFNYVYVNIHREHLDSVSSNNFQLFLDFNLSRSILYLNNQYWLKPVLQPFGRHSTGEIEGRVRPVHAFGQLKAYNATDTAFARPFDEGEFKIRGLKEGVYTVFIPGINGYRDSTINNIVVRRGEDTHLGTIQLHQ